VRLTPGTSGEFLQTQGAGANPQWAAASGGDVVGPAGATDNAITRFNTATGKLIQNSGVLLSDTANISGVNDIALDTISGDANAITVGDGADTVTVNPTAGTSFSDKNITNVADIALDTISSDAGTTVSVTLGTDAGDDFIAGNNNALVVQQRAGGGGRQRPCGRGSCGTDGEGGDRGGGRCERAWFARGQQRGYERHGGRADRYGKRRRYTSDPVTDSWGARCEHGGWPLCELNG
jgi:hypothetical protein